MKSQQIAIYASLNEFMTTIGYQNASDRREDDPVWSTLNDNNYRAMMEYKFGVEPRLISIPTTLEAVHEGVTSHEAWSYAEELEHDDGEEATVPLIQPEGNPVSGDADDREGEQPLDGGEQQPEEKLADEGGETEAVAAQDNGADEDAIPAEQAVEGEETEALSEEPVQQPETPADEQAPETEETPAQEGGDSEQE